MGTVVVDASVLIAELDRSDAHHDRARRAVRQVYAAGQRFSVPASVLSETIVGEARRVGEAGAHRRRGQIEELFGPSRVVDGDIALKAAMLRAEHRFLRLPDALVIATGTVDEADAILTADAQWSKVDDRVHVLT